MNTSFIILIIVIGIIAIFVPKQKKSGRQKEKFTKTTDGIIGRPILSAPELAFYQQLCRSLPNFVVCPQVAANAMLDVDKSLPRSKQVSLRNQYGQWHVDFAVCDPETLNVIGLVEFDGKQHNKKDDEWRDAVLGEGGYKVHRFLASKKYYDSDIASVFEQKLSHEPVLMSVPNLNGPPSTDTQF